jgi:hypothetical protein
MKMLKNLAQTIVDLHGSDLDSIMNDSDFCCESVEQDFDSETTTYLFSDESKIIVGTTEAKAA